MKTQSGLRTNLMQVLKLFPLVFLLTGCVFIRLHKMKKQMQVPKQNFDFEVKNFSLIGRIKKPVIYIDDFSVILKGKPKELSSNKYAYTFSKKKLKDRKPWKVIFWTDDKRKVTAFGLPPRMLQVLGKEFIVDGIRAMGESRIFIFKKSIHLTMRERITQAQFLQLMGQPNRIEGKKMFFNFKSGGDSLDIEITVDKLIQDLSIRSGDYSMFLKFTEESKTEVPK